MCFPAIFLMLRLVTGSPILSFPTSLHAPVPKPTELRAVVGKSRLGGLVTERYIIFPNSSITLPLVNGSPQTASAFSWQKCEETYQAVLIKCHNLPPLSHPVLPKPTLFQQTQSISPSQLAYPCAFLTLRLCTWTVQWLSGSFVHYKSTIFNSSKAAITAVETIKIGLWDS